MNPRPQPATSMPKTRRIGAADAPASLIYLDTSPDHWTPLTAHLHQRLDGRIAQITYPPLVPKAPWASRGLTSALDAVFAEAPGARVLVAASHTAFPVLCWVASSPRRAAAISGLVLFDPATAAPTMLASLDLDRLRTVPTWLITTTPDDTNGARRAREWADLLWADHDVITGTGQHPSSTYTERVAGPILAALQVAHDALLREGA
ncbi:hypothetical protein ABZ413_33735 [Nocardia rhamnosiphila]|uniref:hypothetical protein n=1 Tax=Nocardia rhamnosiphila TaxID=426716 RepID=UPI0033D95EA4